MITLYQFLALDLNEQAEVLWKGAYLGNRMEGKVTVQLYSVSNFYAELYYDRVENSIIKIRPFNNKDLLEPYLQHFDLVDKLNGR